MLRSSITGLCHAISDCHVSVLPQCFMHTVNVHWNGVAIRYHQSLPCFMHSECPLKWCCHKEQSVTAVPHQFDAHSEYTVNQCRHQRSPATMSHSHYDSSTQWISSETVLTSEITSHYVSQSLWLKHTVNIQWNGVAIGDHQPLCLTGHHVSQSLWLHGEYPVKRCYHQRSPSTVSQSLWLKHTVNIQWKGVTMKNHSEITPVCLASFMYTMNVYWNCVAVRNHHSSPVWSTLTGRLPLHSLVAMMGSVAFSAGHWPELRLPPHSLVAMMGSIAFSAAVALIYIYRGHFLQGMNKVSVEKEK